jgi:hypothetical protein
MEMPKYGRAGNPAMQHRERLDLLWRGRFYRSGFASKRRLQIKPFGTFAGTFYDLR